MTVETELKIVESLGRLESRTASLHEDITEIRGAVTRLDDRLDDTRDVAVEAKTVARKSGARTGAGASVGLVTLVEVLRSLIS